MSLTPIIANYLLHLLVCFTAILSLYGILLRLFGRQTGLIVSLILSGYPWFLRAVGWDYLDGFGIAQVMLMLYLLIWAAQADRVRARRILFAAGVVFASLLVSNLFWAGLLPSFIVVYHLSNAENQRHKVVFNAIWPALGAAALILILAVFYEMVTGNFNFIANSLSFTQKISDAAAQNNIMLHKYYGQMPAFWHALPLLVAVISIFMLLRKPSNLEYRWQLRMAVISYILADGFLIFYHFRR